MRAGASLGLRIATAVAFGATAALAVTLNRGAPVHATLASEKGQNSPGAAAATQPAAAIRSAAATQPAAATRSAAAIQSPAAPRCAVSGLRISVGAETRLTAVTTRYALDFTNVGGAPCTLTGYPEVAAYQGDGTEVGDAAVRDTSVTALRVVLAPGQTARASLDASLSARCRPVRVAGLRVVPPGQSAARYVKRPLTACAAHVPAAEDYLQVRAIQPDSGTGNGTGRASAAVP